jgi:hypothetical protein
MAEALEEMCRRLKLSEEEAPRIRLGENMKAKSERETQFSVLFKLMTMKPFHSDVFKSSIRNLWFSTGDLIIRDIDDNLFMAVFNTRDDMERIFVQSPWTFDKKLVQIMRFQGDVQPSDVKFTHAAFWVRVFNLPIKSMTREVGEKIGAAMGRLIEVDVPPDGMGWGRFLRIRVEVEILKPLMRGRILQFENEDTGALQEPFWVDFRYEHLPIFCYRCGRIGHSGNDCLEGRRTGGDLEPGEAKYGAWLRALPLRSPRQQRPYVPPPSLAAEGSASTRRSPVVNVHAGTASSAMGNASFPGDAQAEESSAMAHARRESQRPTFGEVVTQNSEMEVVPTDFVGQVEHGNSNIQIMGEITKLAPITKDKDTVIIEKLNESREQHVSVHNPSIVPPVVDPHEGPPPPKSWKRRARMKTIAEPIDANVALLVGGKRSFQTAELDVVDSERVVVSKKAHTQVSVKIDDELSAAAAEQPRRSQ